MMARPDPMRPDAGKRRLASQWMFLVPSALWMVPMFTQLYKRYPALGSLALPIALLSVIAGGLSIGIYFATGSHLKTSRRTNIVSCLLLAAMGVASGILWAPIVNAGLDMGAARVVDGDVVVIDNPGKGNPSRKVSAVIDGEERRGAFHPHAGFWEAPVVRGGGPAKLTVRPGLFGVWWVAKFDDGAVPVRPAK